MADAETDLDGRDTLSPFAPSHTHTTKGRLSSPRELRGHRRIGWVRGKRYFYVIFIRLPYHRKLWFDYIPCDTQARLWVLRRCRFAGAVVNPEKGKHKLRSAFKRYAYRRKRVSLIGRRALWYDPARYPKTIVFGVSSLFNYRGLGLLCTPINNNVKKKRTVQCIIYVNIGGIIYSKSYHTRDARFVRAVQGSGRI